jgi:hypothetical protein
MSHKKRISFLKLIALNALLLPAVWSCEGVQEEKVIEIMEAEQAKGAVADEAAAEKAGDEESEGELGPSGPVEATWLDIGPTGASGLQTLDLNVRNISPVEVTASVDLICNGFIDKEKTRKMTPEIQKIPIGGDVLFSIPVKRLPIQVLVGAGSFRARVNAILNTDDKVEREVQTSTLFFRHTTDYNKIDVFNINELVESQGGVLVDRNVSKNTVVGRVLDDNDIPASLSAGDANKEVFGSDSKSKGTIDGMEIEFGFDGDGK